jgi:hypothetical protein
MHFVGFKKLSILSLFVFLFTTYIIGQDLDGVRLGFGVGSSIYWGSQMDTKIVTNTLGKSEINSGLNFQIYKSFDNINEFGIRFLSSELWSFKSNNQLALNNQFKELSFLYQRSLNQNVKLNNGPFTVNLLAGVGVLYYSASFYTINNNNLRIFSSIGAGDKPVSDPSFLIKEKVPAISGIIGLNLGFKLSPRLLLYLENSFSLSLDNRFTGNLSLKSKFPNNGFTYNALSLYLYLGSPKGIIRCPKF